ncbi:hypothetical protein N9L68_01545 [bacterium]|nr:hypothetical protein [bacterium]
MVGRDHPRRRAERFALARRLGGTCSDIVRKMQVEELRRGPRNDIAGAIESRCELLVRGLERRHGQCNVETATSITIDMLRFHRLSHGNVDETFSRYET